MAKWRIEFSRAASRQFRRLPRATQTRLLPSIERLAEDPRPPGAKRLTGEELYRIRAGTYRIVYAIEDDSLVVLVVKLGLRRNVYRDL